MSEREASRLASLDQRWSGALLASAAFVFYWATLAPSLVWADGGRLQTEAMTGQSIYLSFPELDPTSTDGWPFERLGVAAWDHPLWVIVGHGAASLPGGPGTYRLNLLSAVAATAAVAVFHRLMIMIVGSPKAALVGSACLAVSHTFWFHAVTAEVYALHIFFMGVLLLVGLAWLDRPDQRLLSLLAFLAGLGGSNHVMLGLTAVPLVIFLAVESRGQHEPLVGSRRARPLIMAGAFLLGLAPWWVQFIRMARLAGVRSTVEIALGFPWLSGRFPGPVGLSTLQNLAEYVALLTYQFTPIGVALGVLGLTHLWRRSPSLARLLVALFVLHAGFSANYDVPDRFTFHITSYAIYSVFIAAGVKRLAAIVRRSKSRVLSGSVLAAVGSVALVATPVLTYAIAPQAVTAFGLEAELGVPDIGRGARDGPGYFLDPNKRGDDSAAVFGQTALIEVAPDALIVAAWPDDQETYVILRHAQLVDGLRPDVHLDLALFRDGSSVADRVVDLIEGQVGCRPVYLASLDPDAYPLDRLSPFFEPRPEGMLYRMHLVDPGRPEPDSCPPLPGATLTPIDLLERTPRD